MHRRTRVSIAAALSLALTLLGSTLPTLAASPPPRGFGFGIVGKITKLTHSSVTVQTSSGSVTDQVTSSTIVMKVTRGSLHDVTAGTFARLIFASGTKTVTAISLSARSGVRPGGTRRPGAGTGAPRAGRFGGGLFAGGQVVKVASGKLTVRTFSGATATYTLAKNVTVTRSVTGKLSDLKVGETVRIGAAPGSKTAFSITIQSA